LARQQRRGCEEISSVYPVQTSIYRFQVTATVYAIFAEKAPVWAAQRELVLRRSCAGDKARPLTGAIGAPSGSSPQFTLRAAAADLL